MIHLVSESAMHKTVKTMKTLGVCALTGAEIGYLAGGHEGAKIGILVGLTVGAGLLIYFAAQKHAEELAPVYPFGANQSS